MRRKAAGGVSATAFSLVTGKSDVYVGLHRPAAAGPWAVIKAYYRDITLHHYRAGVAA